MKFTGFFIVIIASMFLFSCCAGNKAKKEMATENNAPLVKKDDAKKLIGHWLNAKGNFWIEFHENGTYDMGRGDSTTKESRKWAVDENTSVISLVTKNGVHYCDYHFDGDFLIMKLGKKEKNHKFHKVASKSELK